MSGFIQGIIKLILIQDWILHRVIASNSDQLSADSKFQVAMDKIRGNWGEFIPENSEERGLKILKIYGQYSEC